MNASGPAYFEALVDLGREEIDTFGTFMVANCGGTKATITDIFSEVRTCQYLPTIQPYDGKRVGIPPISLLPGQEHLLEFPSIPINLTEDLAGRAHDHPVYVMGRVEYTDDIGTVRTLAFCRQWDKSRQRFEPVNDPDYEYAD